MEIAIGEYDADFPRMMATAVKKYYEDRDKYDLQQLQTTTVSILCATAQTDRNCDKKAVTVYEFTNADDVTAQKIQEIRDAKAATGKFRMEKQSEHASLLMQFLVLYDRYFKACSRNTVSFLSPKSMRSLNFSMEIQIDFSSDSFRSS